MNPQEFFLKKEYAIIPFFFIFLTRFLALPL